MKSNAKDEAGTSSTANEKVNIFNFTSQYLIQLIIISFAIIYLT